jgi:hypothetical protein
MRNIILQIFKQRRLVAEIEHVNLIRLGKYKHYVRQARHLTIMICYQHEHAQEAPDGRPESHYCTRNPANSGG